MRERICVRPFVTESQKKFASNACLGEVLGSIPEFQRNDVRLVKEIKRQARLLHILGMSTIGLSSLAVYEYVRSKGFPLPDSKRMLLLLIPLACATGDDDTVVKNPGEPYVAGAQAYAQNHGGSLVGFRESLVDDEHKKQFIAAADWVEQEQK